MKSFDPNVSRNGLDTPKAPPKDGPTVHVPEGLAVPFVRVSKYPQVRIDALLRMGLGPGHSLSLDLLEVAVFQGDLTATCRPDLASLIRGYRPEIESPSLAEDTLRPVDVTDLSHVAALSSREIYAVFQGLN
jgi:hypothetical protein